MNSKSVSSITMAGAIGLLLSLVLVVSTAEAQTHRKTTHRNVQYPAIGHEVRTLPQGSRSILVSRENYRYYNGSFYHSGRNGSYVVVRAPIGARVRSLPSGYVRFSIGPRDYFYVNLTYYLWNSDRTEYVVVEEPVGAESAKVSSIGTVSPEIFVYPSEGQSDEQRDRDRYECHRWAVDETGFDPMSGESEIDKEGNYDRANSACLEGRGYTVK